MVWRLAGGKGHRRSPGAAVRTADGAGPRDTSVAALPSPTKCLSPELDSFCISCRVWSFLAASAPGAACSCSICKCLQGEGGRRRRGGARGGGGGARGAERGAPWRGRTERRRRRNGGGGRQKGAGFERGHAPPGCLPANRVRATRREGKKGEGRGGGRAPLGSEAANERCATRRGRG